MEKAKSFIITEEDFNECGKLRLDSYLAKKLLVSKNQVSQAILKGLVSLNQKTSLKNGVLLKIGDKVSLLPVLKAQSYQEVKSFNGEIEILCEDEDLMVLNKPPHLVVHSAPSVKEATLVDYLKSKNFSLSTLSGEERYGIIHRLDKPTSGAIVVAKNNEAHQILCDQLKSREMGRYYLAIIDLPIKEKIQVECYMGRNPKNRLKMAKLQQGRYSKSEFFPLLSGELGLIAAKLHTGRTHQIRLHLETISRHIIGDMLYGKQDSYQERLMLHAYIVYFTHPRTREKIQIKAPIFEDMLGFLKKKFCVEDLNDVVHETRILGCF